ncbi:MAG: hypothetical protein V3V78_03365, partial [Candidatus Woesearchaeota archaeon]
VLKLNGTTQTYTSEVQVEDGIIYLDGAFNETGVYYLDWSATYLDKSRTAREIVVVVAWEELLQDINYTVNVELLSLIKENRQALLKLLTDMEYMQEFSEEEIFLITDSVNSMTKVINYLENGKMSSEDAEREFNAIQGELEARFGDRLTGSFIGDLKELGKAKTPLEKFKDLLLDWRLVLFIMLLMMFTVLIGILILLIRVVKSGYLAPGSRRKVTRKKAKSKKQAGKRRYEILIDKIKGRKGKKEKTKKRKKAKKRRYNILADKIKTKIKKKREKKRKKEDEHLIVLK